MALSTVVKHMHDGGTVQAKDGTGTPLTNTIRFDNADLAIQGLRPGMRAESVYQGRGQLRSVRSSTLVFATGSLSWMMAEFSETGTGTMADFLFATSGTPYASRVSTRTADTDMFMFDLVVTEEGTSYGDAADHTITLQDILVTDFGYAQGEPNRFTMAFTIFGGIDGDLSIT